MLNVSCRDRNRFALKSDLLGAGALGIDAVVALKATRFRPDGSAGAEPAHDLDTLRIAAMIADLNRGDTGEGKRSAEDIAAVVPGLVGNPNRRRSSAKSSCSNGKLRRARVS